MANISTWSTTAASNNSATPDGWPEGQNPSTVNDCGREMMASLRTWYEDAEWINWGHTITYVAATQFKISGSDVTSVYSVNRRVRAVGSTTGTIYGIITASSFSTDTTVTVSWDSGSLQNETLTVSVGAIKGSGTGNSVHPYQIIDGVTISTATVATGDKVLIQDADDSDSLKTVTAQSIANLAGGISNLVEDTTPQLGGDLDLNGNNIDFPTTANISDCLDEDDMSSNSATSLATQQSIKTYVDSKVGDKQILQIQEASSSTYGSTTSTIPYDDTVPQYNEGASSGISIAFTPQSASSTLYIFVEIIIDGTSTSRIASVQDSAVNGDTVASGYMNSSGRGQMLTFSDAVASGSTSARTYTLRYGAPSGTTYINGDYSAGAKMGGSALSRLRIIEVL